MQFPIYRASFQTFQPVLENKWAKDDGRMLELNQKHRHKRVEGAIEWARFEDDCILHQ